MKLFDSEAIREIFDPKKDEENKQIWILQNFLISSGQVGIYLEPHGLCGIYKGTIENLARNLFHKFMLLPSTYFNLFYFAI